MKKKPLKILSVCLICVLAAAALGFGAYCLLVRDADLCAVEERRIKNAGEDWLIGCRDGEYFRLCRIAAPEGFARKEAADADGDPLTPGHVYVGGRGQLTFEAVSFASSLAEGYVPAASDGRKVYVRETEDKAEYLLPVADGDWAVKVTAVGFSGDRQGKNGPAALAAEAVMTDPGTLIADAGEGYALLGTVSAPNGYALESAGDIAGDPYILAWKCEKTGEGGFTVYPSDFAGTPEQAGYTALKMGGKDLFVRQTAEDGSGAMALIPAGERYIALEVTAPAADAAEETDAETLIAAELMGLFTAEEKAADAEEEAEEPVLPSALENVCALAAKAVSLSDGRTEALTVTERSISGARAGWLIGLLPGKDGAEDRYVKIAEVSSPSGFNAYKKAEDIDGDSLTNQFSYKDRDSDGNLIFTVYAKPCTTARAVADGYEKTVLRDLSKSALSTGKGGKEISVYARALPEEGVMEYLMASPYDGLFIAVRVTRDPGFSAEKLAGAMYAVAQKITPVRKLNSFIADFKLNFIDDSRWSYLLNGLLVTLMITLLSGLMGVVIGAVVASVRSTWQKNSENMHPGPAKTVLRVLDKICNVYLTVIRGTPVMVQLLIMYLIIFTSASNGTVAAVVAFGINSGAYVAEIIRGGIMSIDNGQFEAGRSLGFNYLQTMWHIILPQVFKSILPTLANEFIALLKETSVSGYVAVKDLNKGGEIIRSVTYSPFLPLLAVAAIYLALVMFFTWLVGKLERRLRSSDH